MQPRRIVIVSPYGAEANNGNWRTARRWQRQLGSAHPVRLVQKWPDADAGDDALMIALHARRSAEAIAAWRRSPGRAHGGLIVVLTGTDLYRDLATDAATRNSLTLADRLVVLQEMAANATPEEFRGKTRVIVQSCTARRTLVKTRDRLRLIMVGHLREEKSPEIFFAAAQRLADRRDIVFDHLGEAFDAAYAEAARETMAINPRYRWFGGLPHATARDRIQRAHLLVHASRLEGGAHVIMEALRSGTPVLASRVAGNVGMLGENYAGYFPWGDADRLVDLLRRCRAAQLNGDDRGLLADLTRQSAARADLFAPERERRALLELVETTPGSIEY